MAQFVPNADCILKLDDKVIKGKIQTIEQKVEYVSTMGAQPPKPVATFYYLEVAELGSSDVPKEKDWTLEQLLEEEYGNPS